MFGGLFCTVTGPVHASNCFHELENQIIIFRCNSSARWETCRILWNWKGSLLCSQELAIDPYHKPREASPMHLFKFQFNIVLPSMPRPSRQSLSFMFDNQNPVHIYFACMLHAMPTSSSSISSPLITGEGYKQCTSTYHHQKDLDQWYSKLSYLTDVFFFTNCNWD